MKVISETAAYALRAILWIAHKGDSQTTEAIASGTGIPPDYLSKVLQRLTRSGLMAGRRGRGGGFRLVVDADTLSVLDVVEAVDPIECLHSCPLGLEVSAACLCPLHAGLNEAAESLRASLGRQRLTDMLRSAAPAHSMCLPTALEGTDRENGASTIGSPIIGKSGQTALECPDQ